MLHHGGDVSQLTDLSMDLLQATSARHLELLEHAYFDLSNSANQRNTADTFRSYLVDTVEIDMSSGLRNTWHQNSRRR